MAEQIHHQRFSGLDLLSVSLLEEIIRADFNGEIEYDSELIEYVLGLIAARKKEEQGEMLPTAQETWQKLQARLEGEDAEALCSIPIKKRGGKDRKRALRYVATLAACFAVFLAVMITVQAMGVNIFGTLGNWTDSQFSFVHEEKETQKPANQPTEITDRFSQTLEVMDFPEKFKPTWIPERYEMTSIRTFDIVNLRGITASYHYPEAKCYLIVEIYQYTNDSVTFNGFHEKDSPPPELYTSKGRTFYIFSNAETWTAAWSDSVYEITISGVETKEEIIKIIDSMKE